MLTFLAYIITLSPVIKVGIPLGANNFNIFSRWYLRPGYQQDWWSMQAVTVSHEQIDLTWVDNFSDEDSFSIERSTDKSTWTIINSPVADEVSYSSTQLTPETLYYYRIRARKGSHTTPYSNIASATTDAAPKRIDYGYINVVEETPLYSNNTLYQRIKDKINRFFGKIKKIFK